VKIGSAAAAAVIAVALVVLLVTSGDDGPETGGPPPLPAATKLAPAGPAQPSRGPQNPPVVVLLLDEFPADVLIGRDGRIDPARYPNLARLARDAYWFPNASTIYDATNKAIPLILDGQLPLDREKAVAADHPNSIFTMLARRGYRIVDSEEATSVCPERLCPGVKRRDGMILRRLASGREERLNDWMAKIGPRRRTLYVKHALLPHVPWIFLPSGRQHRLRARDPVPGIAGPRTFDDPDAARVLQLRQLLQVGYVDRQIGRLRKRLEDQGIWREALLVITADHGYSFKVGVESRRRTDRSNIHEIAPVPMFIKAPGQRRGRTVRSYMRTLDLVPTIADILNIRPGYRVDGHSAFSPAVRRRRQVRVIDRYFAGVFTISARAIERRRARVVRRKLRSFGVGPSRGLDWRLYRGAGPHPELLGRRPAALLAAAPARAHATLSDLSAHELRAVDLDSGLLPNHIAGTLSPSGRKRDIAVAVNGTVRAVGRTFYLDGRSHETFAVLVPEWVLEQGRNEVDVYEVLRRRGSLRLRSL
jgi:hypothetical protein